MAATPIRVPLYFNAVGAGGYDTSVEETVRVFASFEDADEADARDYASMSSEQRLNILIELRDRRHPDAAEQRMTKVSRVVEHGAAAKLRRTPPHAAALASIRCDSGGLHLPGEVSRGIAGIVIKVDSECPGEVVPRGTERDRLTDYSGAREIAGIVEGP